MTIYEYGKDNRNVIVLIHPSLVTWDYFEYVVPFLEQDNHLPWILTRFIALKDFGMMALGKLGGEKMIIKAFSSTEYSEEDLKYMEKFVPNTHFKSFEGIDHGDMALFYPELLAEEIRAAALLSG